MLHLRRAIYLSLLILALGVMGSTLMLAETGSDNRTTSDRGVLE
jgi:hypothetical protein